MLIKIETPSRSGFPLFKLDKLLMSLRTQCNTQLRLAYLLSNERIRLLEIRWKGKITDTLPHFMSVSIRFLLRFWLFYGL